jgi:hypothetical protein
VRGIHHATVNLTGQLGPRWRAKAAFSMGRIEWRDAVPAQDGTGSPAADYSWDGTPRSIRLGVKLGF